jgi:ribosomal protein L24
MIKKDDVVHIVGGQWDGANGIVLKIVGINAIVSVRGAGIERIPVKFLRIPKK